MKKREIKAKRPWKRIRPSGYISHGRFSSIEEPLMPADNMEFDIVTQADFVSTIPQGMPLTIRLFIPTFIARKKKPCTTRTETIRGKR
jgi:hypothetical protein